MDAHLKAIRRRHSNYRRKACIFTAAISDTQRKYRKNPKGSDPDEQAIHAQENAGTVGMILYPIVLSILQPL
jgi:hypothetical protein